MNTSLDVVSNLKLGSMSFFKLVLIIHCWKSRFRASSQNFIGPKSILGQLKVFFSHCIEFSQGKRGYF